MCQGLSQLSFCRGWSGPTFNGESLYWVYKPLLWVYKPLPIWICIVGDKLHTFGESLYWVYWVDESIPYYLEKSWELIDPHISSHGKVPHNFYVEVRTLRSPRSSELSFDFFVAVGLGGEVPQEITHGTQRFWYIITPKHSHSSAELPFPNRYFLDIHWGVNLRFATRLVRKSCSSKIDLSGRSLC